MVPFSFKSERSYSRGMKKSMDTRDPGHLSVATRSILKTQKRLNEPNSKNANPPLNIDDFTHFDFFKNENEPILTQFLSLKPA
jgi:hypothetical protein